MLKPQQVLQIRAGAKARQILADRGLRPVDVVALAAAAGGPKGLALIPLDKVLFGDWLRRESAIEPRLLVGASIGAWRFAAGSQSDPQDALDRLAKAYVGQRYSPKPSAKEVSDTCRAVVTHIGHSDHDPRYRLAVITARSQGWLESQYSAARFAGAALNNLASRARLAKFFGRVVFAEGRFAQQSFDPFGMLVVPMTPDNRVDALLASGSIPLLAEPVVNPPGAPPGIYWDGGLIDYHVAWPWQELDGLVLYPHFVDHIVPGWLDKSLFWRKARGPSLANVIVLSPTPEFLATLPLKALPDRRDFYTFGTDHEGRIGAWTETLALCEQIADAFLAFAADPAAFQIAPFLS